MPNQLYTMLLNLYRNGFTRAKLHAHGFSYKLAGATSANWGCIYIYDTDTGEYYGKIKDSNIIPVYGRSVNDNARKLITEMMNNPLESIISWGHQSGTCGICGRRLDNAISVRNGIGPICAERIGFQINDRDDNIEVGEL